jgi:autoinducer 2-degrading protein
MIVAIVRIHVKPEYLDQFKAATLENARNSILEPGIARFDFVQQEDDPTRFVLIEVFRNHEAQNAHRETAHYAKWRDTVTDWLVEPRSGIRHLSVFPDDPSWEYPVSG